MEQIAFVVLAALALISAAIVVWHRSPLISALSLAANLVCVAGFYLLIHAQFLALLQVIVYAGAIMVLVLFVIMLLNLQDEERIRGAGFLQKWLGMALALGFALILGVSYVRYFQGQPLPAAGAEFGTVSSVGMELFRRFFYPFEVLSLMLIVAMIGAVLLAKRRL